MCWISVQSESLKMSWSLTWRRVSTAQRSWRSLPGTSTHLKKPAAFSSRYNIIILHDILDQNIDRWSIMWLCLLICLFVNGCINNLCAFSLQNGCGSSAPCTLQTPSSTSWSSPSASLDSWTSARMTRSSCSKQVSAVFVSHGLQMSNPRLYNRFLTHITLSTHSRDVAFPMWPWAAVQSLY